MKYIHEFQNNTEFENYYFGQNYIEPHVSLTVDVNRLDYNKSGKALLRGTPITFDVLTDGTITLNNGGSVVMYIDYKLNDGDWTTGVSTPFTINVVSGDSVQFRHNTGSIGTYSRYHYFGGTATFNVKGNIMSLFNGASNDFESRTSLDDSTTFTFYRLFYNCTGLIDASELLLPATTLVTNCYDTMFYGCTSLTTAPELPAPTLVTGCYESMFNGCTSLNYVKCLATDISARYALSDWLSRVSSTGTFYKAAGVTYPSGISGIPTGWTVQDITNE